MRLPTTTTPTPGAQTADVLRGALNSLGKIGRVKMYIPIIDAHLRADPGVNLPSVRDAGMALADGGKNLVNATAIDPGSVAIGRGDATGQAVARAATSQLGVPYSWGGGSSSGPTRGIAQGANTVGFDCSGLTSFAYSKLGIDIPRVSNAQFNAGTKITANNAQAGDLVFFRPTPNGPGHVGVYLGNGNFVAAPQTGDVVKVSKLSSRPDLLGIRRYR